MPFRRESRLSRSFLQARSFSDGASQMRSLSHKRRSALQKEERAREVRDDRDSGRNGTGMGVVENLEVMN